MPKVSVIVTTYNRPELVKETIFGVLNQTFKDFELIVVDNFSNYDFLKVIEEINDDRILPYQNQNDGIIAVNRNFGIKKAKGKYIAFCDDDDIWMPNKLEKQLQFLKDKHLEDDFFLIHTNCLNFNGDIKEKTNKKNVNTINDLIKSNQITFSSVIISNKLLKYNFNEFSGFLAVEDYVFWCMLKLDGYSFFLIKDALVEYRVTKSSASAVNYGLNHLRTIIALMYVIIKNKDAKINYTIYFFSVFKNITKYTLKKNNIIAKVFNR